MYTLAGSDHWNLQPRTGLHGEGGKHTPLELCNQQLIEGLSVSKRHCARSP